MTNYWKNTQKSHKLVKKEWQRSVKKTQTSKKKWQTCEKRDKKSQTTKECHKLVKKSNKKWLSNEKKYMTDHWIKWEIVKKKWQKVTHKPVKKNPKKSQISE